MKTVILQILHFPKSIPNFSHQSPRRAPIYRWVKKLEGGISDLPSKALQMRMGLAVMDEMVEIVGLTMG